MAGTSECLHIAVRRSAWAAHSCMILLIYVGGPAALVAHAEKGVEQWGICHKVRALRAANLNLLKVPRDVPDDKVVLLSDILPTAWRALDTLPGLHHAAP